MYHGVMGLFWTARKEDRLRHLLSEAREALKERAPDEDRHQLRSQILDLLDPGKTPDALFQESMVLFEELDPEYERSRTALERYERSLPLCPFCGSDTFRVVQECAIEAVYVKGRGHDLQVDLALCQGCGRVELFARDPQGLDGATREWASSVAVIKTKRGPGAPYR